MIVQRYIFTNILQGVLLTLLVLVSLNLFFQFISELDDIGIGNYGLPQALLYTLMRLPGKAVEMMPLAVLIGTIMSLGALAGNSEIIVLQSAGLSRWRLTRAVLYGAVVIALTTLALMEWVAPGFESAAQRYQQSSQRAEVVSHSKHGVWLKDGDNIIYIRELLPNGQGRGVEIQQFDSNKRLKALHKAETALPTDDRWRLYQVDSSLIDGDSVESRFQPQFDYPGTIDLDVLESMIVRPSRMSISDLYGYQQFLSDNQRDASVERLAFWRKLVAPFTIVILSLLALPFVLGSQRQSNVGQRIMIGIMLGLSLKVVDKVLIEFGVQWAWPPALNAALPSLLFLGLALFLLRRQA